MRWQGIETAPRETTLIVGIYIDKLWTVFSSRLEEYEGDAENSATVWQREIPEHVSEIMEGGYQTPTHWIPMPSL